MAAQSPPHTWHSFQSGCATEGVLLAHIREQVAADGLIGYFYGSTLPFGFPGCSRLLAYHHEGYYGGHPQEFTEYLECPEQVVLANHVTFWA